jgi:hypothetical protein
MLSHQVDPNLQTKIKKETALHIACRKGFKKIIITLLNHNADPNIQDAVGRTSLHVMAELNSKELVVAFINHCKFPIDWDLVDNIGRKVFDVSTTNEISRLLTNYMKTATAQRYSRETRMYNKIHARVNINSNSRSNSREGGSLSKRNITFGNPKSPDKSPFNTHTKQTKTGANNIMVHQTRNESVKRMFKNFNRTKAKMVSIKKNTNTNGSKPNIKLEKYKTDKSFNSNENSYIIGKSNIKSSNRANYQVTKQSDDMDRLLFQKPKNFEYKHSKLNSEGQLVLNETRGKKEPNVKGNRGEIGFSNTQIVDYFDSARRISADEDPKKIVQKIEISLSDGFNKKKSHQSIKSKLNEHSKNKTQLLSESLQLGTHNSVSNHDSIDSKSVSLKNCTDEISNLVKNNVDDESIPNQLHHGKSLPHSNTKEKKVTKTKFRDLHKTTSPTKTKSSKKDATQTYDNSDMIRQRKDKRAVKKDMAITENHKNDIIKTISNKIKDSYLNNFKQGSQEHNRIMKDLDSMDLDDDTYQDIIDKVG